MGQRGEQEGDEYQPIHQGFEPGGIHPAIIPPAIPIPINNNQRAPSPLEGDIWLVVVTVACYVIGAMAAGIRTVAWERAVILLRFQLRF